MNNTAKYGYFALLRITSHDFALLRMTFNKFIFSAFSLIIIKNDST